MATHQVEQYYVHVNIKTLGTEEKEKIKTMLIENNWDDHEFGCDYLVVDGFESEVDAEMCDEMVNEHLVT